MGIVQWFMRLFGLAPSAPSEPTPPPFVPRRPARLSVAEVLRRVRELHAQSGQWVEIWAQVNPGNDPEVQQLLLDLRNDGLQFAPSDGLSKIEQACLSLSNDGNADAVAVLRKALGRDFLDKFE